MIQRIQTLYLLLATVFTGLLLFVPLATSDVSGMHIDLTAWGVYVTELTNNAVINEVVTFPWFGILLTVTTLLPFVTIDLPIAEMPQPKFVMLSQSGLLLLSIVSVWIARRRIAKDEALVRSLDRIR